MIIIGAGIGGLFSGCHLAKQGKRVLIIESHDKPGGCISSIKRMDAIFDVGAHLIGSCGSNGIFNRYLRELDVNVNFIQLNPTDRFHFPNRTIDVPQNIDEFKLTLQNIFPDEADMVNPFFKEMLRIASHFDNKKILDLYQEISYEQLLDRYFKSSELKGILSAQYNYIGVSPKRASALAMCLMLSSYLKDGCFYVKGGSQNLPNKLADRFIELGGRIIYKTRVVKITVNNNIGSNVCTNDFNKYESDFIISNIDARKTLFNLVGKEHLPVDYVKKVEHYSIGPSFFLIFLTVDIKTEYLENVSGWYHSSYDLNNIATESFYLFVPTIFDKSLHEKGYHIIEMAMPFHYEYNKVIDWSEMKTRFENIMINRASNIIKNLKESIVYKFIATPATIERFTGNSKGSMCGWEMSVDQVQRHRLGNVTPIKNMFLVGHWTKPGCGIVSVATSGWKVSKELENLDYHGACI